MEYFPSLSVVAVRLISSRRTVVCGTGLPPASVTRPESVRASDPERAAAAVRHRPLAVATHARIVATRAKCVVVICSPLASRRLQCPPAPGGECRLREEWLRGPARRVCDASCRQESAGGARGWGRSRSVARRKGAGAAGRATRLSATSRLNRMARPPRVGAERKWHSAQSGAWMRAQLFVVWDSMCAVAWVLAASRRASANAAAPGSSSCRAVARSHEARAADERLRIANTVTYNSTWRSRRRGDVRHTHHAQP